MSQYIYVCNIGNSQKVWGYDTYTHKDKSEVRVIYYWGSIGRRMQGLQKREKVYGHRVSAEHDIREKIEDKMKKGYDKVRNSVYFDAVYELHNKIEDEVELVLSGGIT